MKKDLRAGWRFGACVVGIVAAVGALPLWGAVEEGENILVNGRFEADQTDLPLHWAQTPKDRDVELSWHPSAGPNGLPAISCRATGPHARFCYRQFGLGLVAEGRYRFSGCYRTKDFSGTARALIINDGWTATGSVKPATYKGLGAAQIRWGGNGDLGDSCAEFCRSDGEPGRISQKMTGLVPGKLYRFECLVADPKLYADKKHAPKADGLTVSLGEGAEIQKELSWSHEGRINVRHFVFRATAPETTLTFDDAAAAPGTKTLLNGVLIVPYYSEPAL